MRKAIAPFPSLQRLARHVKEVHIQKSQGRVVHPDHRSKYVDLTLTFSREYRVHYCGVGNSLDIEKYKISNMFIVVDQPLPLSFYISLL